MIRFLREVLGGRMGRASAAAQPSVAPAGQPPAAVRGPETPAGTFAPGPAPSRDLRESEEQFAKLVSGVRDYAVFLLDRHGNILTWNAGAERNKGYRAEEIIGRHFSVFYPSDSISSGWPAHELEVASATGRFEDEGWRLRKDGSRFWASVVITALREEGGEVRGFLKITRDLTDRKQAEEKLRLSEERFRLLVEGVRDYAIFMLDPEGHVTTWNAGAERLKGYTATEILGQHFTRFYPPDALERGWPAEELRRATADGRVEDEGWRLRKDGSRFWASVVITAIRDESGTLRGFAKLTRDQSDRMQAEESTRRLLQEEAARRAAEAAADQIDRQREQLQVTLASIGDAVIVTDAAGNVTFLNPVAVALTGWELYEASGKPLSLIFPIINEDTRNPVENPVDIVFRENRIVELANHTALVAKDGREIPVEDTAAPIRLPSGAIGGAVLVFRDVTAARRAAEDRLHLAAIVESSDDAIIGQTLDGRVASWNRGAERLYGYKASEVIDQPLTVMVPTDHKDEVPEMTERIRRGESIDHYETQRVRKDGSRVEVSLTISPIKNADGKVIGASKIARDITARKEEERRKNEFLALLAHELRNPLAPLRNGLQVIRMADHDREVIQEASALMERQLQHFVRLVDDLLDLARISQGKLQLRRERIELTAAVKHSLDVCGQSVAAHGHELKVTLPQETLYIEADQTRLAQTICNLLSNAAKYSPGRSTIRLEAGRSGQDAFIAVSDQGVGIPADMLPRVFEMFMQVDRSLEKSQGGLGVGLSIVKRLIEMHGGSVEARSEGLNKGSEFVIRLPLASPAADAAAPTDQIDPAADAPRRKILVVDDNVDAAVTLGMVLKMTGNDVRTAHDGRSAIEVASAFRLVLILLDIGMPGLSGYDTARLIRSEPWGQDMVLAALTGWGQEEDRRKSEEAGFDHHLLKPVEPNELAKLLAQLPR